MGYGKWSADDYRERTSSFAGKSTAQVYANREAPEEVRPESVGYRESRDSAEHPISKPIILGLDVTGSMGFIADDMARNSLGLVVNDLLQRFKEFDPHILFAAFGDTYFDEYPLQITQFESDTVILGQLTSLFLEHGGGGNGYESEDLVWAFAARKTQSDAWSKRKEKGYLFTIGDEEFPEICISRYYETALGYEKAPKNPEEVLKDAEKRYSVFHVIVKEGYHASRHFEKVLGSWSAVLGKRCLVCENHRHIAYIISAAIALQEGRSYESVIGPYAPDIQETLNKAFAV